VGLTPKLSGGIAVLGEEAAAAVVTDGGTEALLLDPLAELFLLAVGAGGEAALALVLEQTVGAALAGRAMADTTADGRALKGATETWSDMRIMDCNLGHGAPPGKTQQAGCRLLALPEREVLGKDGGMGKPGIDEQ